MVNGSFSFRSFLRDCFIVRKSCRWLFYGSKDDARLR